MAGDLCVLLQTQSVGLSISPALLSGLSIPLWVVVCPIPWCHFLGKWGSENGLSKSVYAKHNIQAGRVGLSIPRGRACKSLMGQELGIGPVFRRMGNNELGMGKTLGHVVLTNPGEKIKAFFIESA